MIHRFRSLLVAALFCTRAVYGQHVSLEPMKPIGVGWHTDKWGWMSFVAFSPDGGQVASDGATAPDDVTGNLSFWSFPEGQLLKRLPVSGGLSPNWKYYASAHDVGEIETGRILTSLQAEDFAVFTFSPDSRYLAESLQKIRGRGGRILIMELPSQKRVSTFGRYAAQSLAISPDGITLASGYWDEVILWNMMTGTRIGSLKGFGRYVCAISFSKDGKYLAAGTDLGDLQIWDVSSRKQISSIHLDGQFVSEPAFSPDGTMVAVGSYGTGTVWLVDAHSGKLLDHRKISDLGCGSVAFSPNGNYLIAPSTGGIVTWPYDRGGTIRVFKVSSR